MTGDLHGELQHLKTRFEQAPDSRLFAPLADAYRKNGEIDRAIELCERGLEHYPDYASAHVILGKCFYDKGATERARAEFMRVLELDQENMVALKFMGDIHLAEGNQVEAADYFKRFLALDPTNDEVISTLSEMESEFQGPDIDLSDEKSTRRMEHPRELATMTLAGIYAAQGYYNKALKIYQDILRREPDNSEAQEMVDKLQGLLNAGEKERSEAFKEDVLTISLDEVEGVVSSTAGPGGAADDAGGDEPSPEQRETGTVEKDKGWDSRRKEEPAEDDSEVREIVDELEHEDADSGSQERDLEGSWSDDEEYDMQAGKERDEHKPADGKSRVRDIENFQEWLRRMKGGKNK
jgi:tetratricopeptide (TPR) repeat protein